MLWQCFLVAISCYAFWVRHLAAIDGDRKELLMVQQSISCSAYIELHSIR